MTAGPLLILSKLKLKSLVANKMFLLLSSALDQLGRHRHVHEFICNAHHHAANNRSINSVGDECLLSRLEESRQGALDLLLVCSVELLGSSDDADDLATMRCHQSGKGRNHCLGEAQPVILSQSFKQVLAQVGNLEGLAHSGDSVKLEVVLDGGVKEEGAKARVRVHGG